MVVYTYMNKQSIYIQSLYINNLAITQSKKYKQSEFQ